MKRIQNIDKLRGAACLMVLLYHIYAVTGVCITNMMFIGDMQKLGGAVGVTIFFVLSGYGIFCLLFNMETTDSLNYVKFIKQRIAKIVPQYYFNIVVLLLITSSAVYLSKQHILNIISHFLFLHSFSFASHGAINGVLWTMAITFQFYLVAVPLYKIMTKVNNPIVCIGISVVATIIMKYMMLNYWWVENENIYGGFATFIPGRQLITSLDNFVCGMAVAQINIKKEKMNENKYAKVILFIAMSSAMFILVRVGMQYGISNRNILGYTYYSGLALIIAGLIYGISFDMKNGYISKALLWVSKHEYAIYLWHLPIINNLFEKSDMVSMWIQENKKMELYIFLVGVCIGIAAVIDELFAGVKCKKRNTN